MCVVFALPTDRRPPEWKKEGMPEWENRRFWSSLFKVFSQIHNFPQLCCTCSCRGESPLSTGIGLHTAKCCQKKHCPFSLGHYLANFNRKFYEFLAKFWKNLFYKMRKSVFFGPRNMLNMDKWTQKTLKIDRFCPFLEILFFWEWPPCPQKTAAKCTLKVSDFFQISVKYSQRITD